MAAIIEKINFEKAYQLRKYLKDTKIDYNEKVLETITFGASEEETRDAATIPEQEQQMSMSQEQQMDGAAPIIQFELIQIVVKSDKGKNAILSARAFQ